MKRAWSITLRLALLSSAASLMVLLIVGIISVRQLRLHFEEMDLESLRGKVALVRGGLAKLQAPSDLERVGTFLDEALIGHEHLSVAVLDGKLDVLFATTAVALPRALLDEQARLSDDLPRALVAWTSGGQRYRGLVVPARAGLPGSPRLTVMVALNVESHHAFVRRYLTSLVWPLCCALALTLILSWVAARRGLAPIPEITAAAKKVSAQRLGERLPAATVPIELAELVTAFNDMLDRLEDSFARLTAFSADLAHELRTPISNVMTQLQVALSQARSPQEYREVLHSALEEHERVARMVGDMLFLAKADNGLLVPSQEAVDLVREATELQGFYSALAEEHTVSVEVKGAGSVQGDRLMLRRAISNLLSNAIRHAQAGSLVAVEIVSLQEGAIELSVQNHGLDIAAAHLPRLFDRFYQVDPSRSRTGEGAGLGLAITQAIARAHGATLHVRSADGVTRLSMCFPAPQPQGGTEPQRGQ